MAFLSYPDYALIYLFIKNNITSSLFINRSKTSMLFYSFAGASSLVVAKEWAGRATLVAPCCHPNPPPPLPFSPLGKSADMTAIMQQPWTTPPFACHFSFYPVVFECPTAWLSRGSWGWNREKPFKGLRRREWCFESGTRKSWDLKFHGFCTYKSLICWALQPLIKHWKNHLQALKYYWKKQIMWKRVSSL